MFNDLQILKSHFVIVRYVSNSIEQSLILKTKSTGGCQKAFKFARFRVKRPIKKEHSEPRIVNNTQR